MLFKLLYGYGRKKLWLEPRSSRLLMACSCNYSDVAARRSRFGRKLEKSTAKAEINKPSNHVKSKDTKKVDLTSMSHNKFNLISKALKSSNSFKSTPRQTDIDQTHLSGTGGGDVKDKSQVKDQSFRKNEKSSFKNTEKLGRSSDSKPKVKTSNSLKKKKNQKLVRKKHLSSMIKLDIPSFLSVANLASILRVRVPDLVSKMKGLEFENISNDYIMDADTAGLIAEEYGFEVNQDDKLGADLFPSPEPKDKTSLKSRSPVVTIMGHVDHGKTTILDYFRRSSIAKDEKGGITQRIGAFVVKPKSSERSITFLDTPGHAAFLKMRERGANMTDIVVLVVAAEDSVMPQTIEAIKHTKSAGVPMIVAINKCDKPDANPDKVVADLSRNGVDVEDYGGEVPVIRISAKTGMGMKDLEETIITVAELLELKAETQNIPVEGWILESQVKHGLGNCATFLLKKGILKKGMILVAGTTWCKVRVMKDENGKSATQAKPAFPVEISGWKDIPEAGDFAIQAKNEAFAKKVVANRERRKQQLMEADQVEDMNNKRLKQVHDSERVEKIQEYQDEGFSMDEIKQLEPDLFETEKIQTKRVSYIIKADVSGSAEAVRQSIEGLGNDEVTAFVLYAEVGPPTESDIERAKSSGSTILVFNMKVARDIANSASSAGVKIQEFGVIYHLIESVVTTLTETLPVKFETKVVSKASIKKLFEISLKGKNSIVIAGSRVTDGILKKSLDVRIVRNGETIYNGKIKELKIEKDDVAQVKNGGDCGIALEGDPDLEVGDTIENLSKIPLKRHL